MVFSSTFPDVEPPAQLGGSLGEFYWRKMDEFASNTLLVDNPSGREWKGHEIAAVTKRIAAYLVHEICLKPGFSCVLLTLNSDYSHLAALGVILAGGSVCAASPLDPIEEIRYVLDIIEPELVFAQAAVMEELVPIQRELKFRICIIDDNSGGDFGGVTARLLLEHDVAFGFHSHVFDYRNSSLIQAVRVDPNSPAYVLLTSGSTGSPKAVARTHLNCLYVCHSLDMEPPLWDLGPHSVLSNHVPLDHGTGTFCIKMTLSKGLKLVVLPNYELGSLLDAVERHGITDVMLGSAHLHNLMGAAETGARKLDSLRNLMAVGSRLVSHDLACSFMDRWPEARVRQTLGMTEVGFISMVPRESARSDGDTVGLVLPNLRVKLLDLQTGEEVSEVGREGLMQLSGGTVSPGYMGARFSEQSEAVFGPGGLYKSSDVCRFTEDRRLVICGRQGEMLCLDDGWKVLPREIEDVILKHPGVSEAAVVGVPHPDLPGCHAPRAFVVASEAWRERLSAEELIGFVAERVSEHKRLSGGLQLLAELPRVTLGKVDRRALLDYP